MIGVLIVHLHERFFGGIIGVDVFFALSGFLITSILLRQTQEHGRIRLGDFYLRRALRLFPPLLLTIAVATVLTVIEGHNSTGQPLSRVVPAVLFYCGNWLVVVSHRGLGFLDHTWSLAVEEQFYILWPLALLSRWVRKHLLVILLATIAVIIVARFIVAGSSSSAPFDWTFFRADELFVGAGLAVLVSQKGLESIQFARSSIVAWCSVAALAIIAALIRLNDYQGLLKGGYTLVAVCSALIIAHILVAPTALLPRILSLRPLAAVGRVSYGIYLYHYPFFIYFHDRFPGDQRARLACDFLTVSSTVLLSWYIIEKPAARLKSRLSSRTLPSDSSARTLAAP